MSSKALINFSSHALSEKAKEMLKVEYDIIEEIYIHSIDLRGDVGGQLQEVIRKVETKLDGSIPISIIVPGQATIAVLLIAFLSGILGHIPNVCLLEMDNDGFYVPTSKFIFNGSKIKSDGRRFRQELWDQN